MYKSTTMSMPMEAFLSLLAFLTVRTTAQSMSNTDVVTSYYSVCPTASSTTITLPTTITYCPGPNCNGGGPAMTSAPAGPGAGGVYISQTIIIGSDGKENTMGIYQTIVDHLGPDGIVSATYTITEPCPCHETMPATVMPLGFETTVVPCHVCAATGGHSTITLTQPCPTGPYASQTPVTGQTSAPSPAMASAPGPAWASGSNSGSGSGSGSGMSQCPAGQYCPGNTAAPTMGSKSNSTSGIVIPPISAASGVAIARTAAMPTIMFGLVLLFAIVL